MTTEEKSEFVKMQDHVKNIDTQFSIIQTEFKLITGYIHDIKSAYSSFTTGIQILKDALEGNSILKDGGIVSRMLKLEKESKDCQEELADQIDKVTDKIEAMERESIPTDTRLKILWWVIAIISGCVIQYLFYMLYTKPK